MLEDPSELETVAGLLPPVVIELIELIGYRHVAILIKKFGGISFPVTQKTRTNGNRLADLLTQELPDDSVKLIIERFGGDVLYIPRCDAALRELRNRRFLNEYRNTIASGESGRFALMHLCPRFGFSDRYAQRVIAKSQQTKDELDQL
nr:Mor transcription activator family protein [uncultured Enterobacter sp.]